MSETSRKLPWIYAGLLQRRLRRNCLESLSAKIKPEKRLPRIILGGRFFGILCKEKYDSKNEMNPEGFLHLGHRIWDVWRCYLLIFFFFPILNRETNLWCRTKFCLNASSLFSVSPFVWFYWFSKFYGRLIEDPLIRLLSSFYFALWDTQFAWIRGKNCEFVVCMLI